MILRSPALLPTAGLTYKYHAQDELGQASFGYSHPGQSSSTVIDAAGNHIGSYSYVDPFGKLVQVSYVADGLGFRQVSNNLPVAPATGRVMLGRGLSVPTLSVIG